MVSSWSLSNVTGDSALPSRTESQCPAQTLLQKEGPRFL